MALINLTAKSIRPLPGAIILRMIAGGAGNVGDSVYIAADADAEVGNGGATATAYTSALVVSAPNGRTSFVAGDAIDVVVYGPVSGFTGMTPRDIIYQSDTDGRLADTAGTNSHKFGRAWNATTLFVNPALTEA